MGTSTENSRQAFVMLMLFFIASHVTDGLTSAVLRGLNIASAIAYFALLWVEHRDRR